MNPITAKPSSKSHMVAMPYPGRGHINPMMNLCKSLASKTHDLLVSFVVTEEWLTLIASDPKPPQIRFITMPNVIPSELVRGVNMADFFEAVTTKMEAPFEQILDGLEPPATFMIADALLAWTIPVGNRRNIPVASLFPMSAMTFSVFQHFHLLEENGHFPVDLLGRGDEIVDYIPGVSPTRLKDLPSSISRNNLAILNPILESYSWLPKAQFILISTIYELEPEAIDNLRDEISLPIYTFGPAIPYTELQNLPFSSSTEEELDYLGWLDSKPSKSVLYISLGSYTPVCGEQMDEVEAALQQIGVPFLWVVRGEIKKSERHCGNLGKIVPWCDQLSVLCHPSIGGFLSHCGWNSVQEGVFAGVPFLTFPLTAEQFLNAKLIVDDWKIGYRIRKEVTRGELVTKEEISGLVKKLMDRVSDEGKATRGRLRELRELCHGAIVEDGSTSSSIKTFTGDIHLFSE